MQGPLHIRSVPPGLSIGRERKEEGIIGCCSQQAPVLKEYATRTKRLIHVVDKGDNKRKQGNILLQLLETWKSRTFWEKKALGLKMHLSL